MTKIPTFTCCWNSLLPTKDQVNETSEDEFDVRLRDLITFSNF